MKHSILISAGGSYCTQHSLHLLVSVLGERAEKLKLLDALT